MSKAGYNRATGVQRCIKFYNEKSLLVCIYALAAHLLIFT